MKPPTKYELMRKNRARRKARADASGWGVSSLRLNRGVIPAPNWPDKTPAEPPKPPTMTVDGVDYVEAPPHDPMSCAGCAFRNSARRCFWADDAVSAFAKPVFGGDCSDRNVIYLKAF